MGGGQFVSKAYAGDKEADIYESAMAEKRKYCEFGNGDIDWSIDSDNDANVTRVYPNSDSLEFKCPNGFVINSIKFSGVGSNHEPADDYNGLSQKLPIISKIGSHTRWTNAERSCTRIDSNLISIHSEIEEDYIIDIFEDHLDYIDDEDDAFWIGLNDLANEEQYVWSDGTTTNYFDWQTENLKPDAPENNKYCKKKHWLFGNCEKWEYHGEKSDSIQINEYGWDDQDDDKEKQWLCKNPNVNFNGEENSTSFRNAITYIDCVQANRGPFLQCQEFTWDDISFGDVINAPYKTFNCEGTFLLFLMLFL